MERLYCRLSQERLAVLGSSYCSRLYSPVSYGKVFLLLQRMNEGDQKVFVVDKGGKQRESLLQVGPHTVR